MHMRPFSLAHPTRHFALKIVAIASVTWSIAGGLAAATVESPLDVGEVVIVEAYDQTTSLERGDAGTEFTLRLPDGSTCPGDSANDQWRVQSFIIPVADDPVDNLYGPIGPEPWDQGDRYAVFREDTRPFVHQPTLKNPAPGQPGVIAALPPMTFTVIEEEGIPDGRYRIGVACTYFGSTAKYWDTEIVFSTAAGADGDTDLGTLTWRLASAPATDPDGVGSSNQGGLGRWGLPAAAGLGAVVAAWYLWQRRSRRTTTLAKDPH